MPLRENTTGQPFDSNSGRPLDRSREQTSDNTQRRLPDFVTRRNIRHEGEVSESLKELRRQAFRFNGSQQSSQDQFQGPGQLNPEGGVRGLFNMIPAEQVFHVDNQRLGRAQAQQDRVFQSRAGEGSARLQGDTDFNPGRSQDARIVSLNIKKNAMEREIEEHKERMEAMKKTLQSNEDRIDKKEVEMDENYQLAENEKKRLNIEAERIRKEIDRYLNNSGNEYDKINGLFERQDKVGRDIELQDRIMQENDKTDPNSLKLAQLRKHLQDSRDYFMSAAAELDSLEAQLEEIKRSIQECAEPGLRGRSQTEPALLSHNQMYSAESSQHRYNTLPNLRSQGGVESFHITGRVQESSQAGPQGGAELLNRGLTRDRQQRHAQTMPPLGLQDTAGLTDTNVRTRSQTVPEVRSQGGAEIPVPRVASPEHVQESPHQEIGKIDIAEVERKMREQRGYICDLEASMDQINCSIREIARRPPEFIALKAKIDRLKEEKGRIDNQLKTIDKSSKEYNDLYEQKIANDIQICNLECKQDKYDVLKQFKSEEFRQFRELTNQHRSIEVALNEAREEIALLEAQLDQNARSMQETDERDVGRAGPSGTSGRAETMPNPERTSGMEPRRPETERRVQTMPVARRLERRKQQRIEFFSREIVTLSRERDILSRSIAEQQEHIRSLEKDIKAITTIDSNIKQLRIGIAKAESAITSGQASTKEIFEQQRRPFHLRLAEARLEDLNPIVGGKRRLQTLQEKLANSQAKLRQSQQQLEITKQYLHSCREERTRLLGSPLE